MSCFTQCLSATYNNWIQFQAYLNCTVLIYFLILLFSVGAGKVQTVGGYITPNVVLLLSRLSVHCLPNSTVVTITSQRVRVTNTYNFNVAVVGYVGLYVPAF